MKINKKFKIEKVTRSDDTRFILRGVLIKDGKAAATDGRALAVVPIRTDEEGDSIGKDGVLIPVEALKEARKIDRKEEYSSISINGNLSLADGRTFKEIEGKYPNIEQVIPKKDRKGDRKIVLDPELLLKIAQAIGFDKGNGIVLSIPENTGQPIRITNPKEPEALGVLMPMRL